MSKFKFGLKAKIARMEAEKAVTAMGYAAIKHFKVDVFDREAFDGVKWKPRQDPTNKRRLLVKTGRMRNSINFLRRTRYGATIGTRVKYAKYHNDGTSKLPQRQFIGNTRELTRIHMRMLKTVMARV